MIQSGVTRAVRAWAGEASSRLAAKSRAQKLRRLSRAPIEAIEAIEIVAGRWLAAVVRSVRSASSLLPRGWRSTQEGKGGHVNGDLGTSYTNTRTGGWLTTNEFATRQRAHLPSMPSEHAIWWQDEEEARGRLACKMIQYVPGG